MQTTVDEEWTDDLDTDDDLLSAFAAIDKRLGKDLRQAALTLTPAETRYLVDRYYQSQENRKRAAAQLRAASADAEPNAFLAWDTEMTKRQEANIRSALAITAPRTVPGRWCLSILGIGPVITAGLLAHFDITKAPTPGHFWSFAGLNPTVVWEKSQKRPWNASLKVLCWKVGDSFVKISNRPNDTLYGQLYRKAKARVLAKDADGGYATLAEQTLAAKKFKDKAVRARYESGHLPDGRLDLGARRQAVKIFLAHLHHVMYETHYGKPPALPYILAHDPRHTHYIPPPHWPLE